MKTLVVLPMGAHPFHAGHMALYNSAKAAFPDSDVYIAATNDTSTRPFPFAVKQKLAKLSGVPENRFIPVKSPFRADEITQNYDPADTQLIFVRSQKDADKPPLPGSIRKDGTPGYLQPISDQMAPMTQHAYMAYLPTVEFGPGMTSATQIRTAWPSLTERQRTALVMSLYPHTQKNPKLASTVVRMLDTAMGAELTEVLDTKAGTTHHAHWNASDPDMIKFTFTASNGVEYQLDFLEPYIGPDEMSPYDFFDSDEVYNKSKFVSFEQLTKDIKGGYPVAKQGIEGTGSAAEVFGIVVHAIIQYVKKARPALLYFQAAEPNRRALYARMIQRVLPALPGWASMTVGNGEFGIYNKRAVKSAMGTEVAEQGYGTHPSQRVDPRTGKRYVPPPSPLGQGVAEGQQDDPEDYRAHLIKTLPAMMNYFAKTGKGWSPSKEQMLSAVDTAYEVMKHTGDVQQAGKALMDKLNTLHRMSQGQQGVAEEVTRQMSQGGMTASYQSKYNQPIAEDYLDEARS